MSSDAGIFNPDSQDHFWKMITPDMRAFLGYYEEQEDWTFTYQELPEGFVLLSQALPKFSIRKATADSETIEILEKMIVILASMPFRQAISALSWLDKDVEEVTDINWAVALFMHATTITMFEHDHMDFKECKNLHDRCSLILHSKLSTKLFSQLNQQNLSSMHDG